MVFGLATIGLDGFAMVFGLATIGLNGFSMIANHWSNDGMVTIHRYGLVCGLSQSVSRDVIYFLKAMTIDLSTFPTIPCVPVTFHTFDQSEEVTLRDQKIYLRTFL